MKISKTYQIITEESAREGLPAEHGFVYERQSMTVDELMDEMTTFVEPCSSNWGIKDLRQHFFFTSDDPEVDLETGEHTYYAWHIDEATDLELMKLYIVLKRSA